MGLAESNLEPKFPALYEMKLKLFVDIFNRKLVTSATSDFPVELPSIFREDHIELELSLIHI